jgi:multidrug efflux pump
VVVSGMMIGTLFTLFVLPAVYVAIATDHRAASESERAREIEEFDMAHAGPSPSLRST